MQEGDGVGTWNNKIQPCFPAYPLSRLFCNKKFDQLSQLTPIKKSIKLFKMKKKRDMEEREPK